MKFSILAMVLAVIAAPLFAVEAGDAYEKVLESKGKPASQLKAGDMVVLNYPDSTIKLQEGKVVSVTAITHSGKKSEKVTEPAKKTVTNTKAENIQPPQQLSADSGEWTTDYEAALRQAQVGKKRVFLFFTGSDWCGWCKRMDGEILSTDAFTSYAREHLVLVKLDFPREIPQPAETKARNRKLAEQYGVKGFPTIIVLNSAGSMVGQLGYQEGGPQPFINELEKL